MTSSCEAILPGAACALNGWDRTTYLHPDHPLQRLVHTVVEQSAGEPVTAVGTTAAERR